MIPLSFTLNLSDVMGQLQASLPSGIDADGAWGVIANDFAGNVALKYRVWRGIPQIQAAANTISLKMPIFYHAAMAQRIRNGIVVGGYSWHQIASCGLGEPAREADVQVQYSLSWTSSYHLAAPWKWTLTHVRPCTVTVGNYNLSGRINSEIKPQLDAPANKLMTIIQSVDLKPLAQKYWDALNAPLYSADRKLILHVFPVDMRPGPITGDGSQIGELLVLLAMPVISESTQGEQATHADTFTPRPLPGLVSLSAAPNPHFHVNVRGALSFDVATREAKSRLDGRQITWANLHSTVTVESVAGNDQLAYAKLLLTGAISGTVYLSGTMNYDPNKNEFSITNLHLTPEEVTTFSNDVIAVFNNPDILASIANEFKWNVTGHLNLSQERANEAMNSTLPNGFKLSGGVSPIQVASIVAYPSECSLPPGVCKEGITQSVFVVFASLSGTLAVNTGP
jgi:hypothetical protein